MAKLLRTAVAVAVGLWLAACGSSHLTTLHLSATVYDVRKSTVVYSSKERVDEGATKLGEDSSTCAASSPDTFRCLGRYTLTSGTIQFSGTISNASNTNRLKITGGTGRYKGARGTVLTEYNSAGTKAKETLSFN
jgi:hypothetical protein